MKADIKVKSEDVAADSDIRALIFDKVVSVTPLTLDMTARVNLAELEKKLKAVMIPGLKQKSLMSKPIKDFLFS